MRDTADMPKLKKDQPALGMHGIDHAAPSFHLRLRIDAGHAGIAAPRHGDRRRFRDQQTAGRGALAIIFRIERPRHETQSFGAHSCQRRHHHAMAEPVRTDLKR
jgi:hypothetical protein